MRTLFSLYVGLLIISVCGCAGFSETCRGFTGISTKILEDNRGSAIVAEYDRSYLDCLAVIKSALEAKGSYVYADDRVKQLLAVYVSQQDTTPVGIFLTEVSSSQTRVEVSSPSSYAKGLIAKIVAEAIVPPVAAMPQKEVTQ